MRPHGRLESTFSRLSRMAVRVTWCPYCGALEDIPCITSGGLVARRAHDQRIGRAQTLKLLAAVEEDIRDPRD